MMSNLRGEGGVKQNRAGGVGGLSKIGRPIILQFLSFSFWSFILSLIEKEKNQVVDDDFIKNFLATSFTSATCEF